MGSSAVGNSGPGGSRSGSGLGLKFLESLV